MQIRVFYCNRIILAVENKTQEDKIETLRAASKVGGGCVTVPIQEQGLVGDSDDGEMTVKGCQARVDPGPAHLGWRTIWEGLDTKGYERDDYGCQSSFSQS